MATAEHDAYLTRIIGLDVARARLASTGSSITGARTSVEIEADGTINLGGSANRGDSRGTPSAKHAPAPPQPVASTKVPRPVEDDCMIVTGKVPGPKDHVLCKTHLHVIDMSRQQIIANSVDDYKKSFPAHDANRSIGQGTVPPGPKPGEKMSPDCKIVRGKVPGPEHHVLCGTHHHVIDEAAGTIIADSIADYKTRFPVPHGQKPALPGAAKPAPAASASPMAHGHATNGHGGGTHGRGTHASAPDGKGSAPDAPDQKLPDENVTGEGGGNRAIIDSAHNVTNVARTNSLAFARSVERACEQFKTYADGRMKSHSGDFTMGDLLQMLAGQILTPIGGAIAAKITSSVGKAIYAKINGALQAKVMAAAAAAPQDAQDLAAASAAIGKLIDAAKEGADSIVETITVAIQKPCDQIINKINSNEQLSERDNEFIMPFYSADTGIIDEELEHYGVPSPESTKKTQVEIYKGMVKAFEKKMILAESSAGEKIEMAMKEGMRLQDGSLEDKASKTAEKAAKALEEHKQKE